jgi:hypothetical protein
MIMLDSKGTASPAGIPAKSDFESSLEQIPTINQETPGAEEISVEDIPF